MVTGNSLTDLAGKKGLVAINRHAMDRIENVAHQAASHARLEYYRNLLRLDLHRMKAPQGPPGRGKPHLFGILQSVKSARQRTPVVALHGVAIASHGHGADGTVTRAVFACEATGIDEDVPAEVGI